MVNEKAWFPALKNREKDPSCSSLTVLQLSEYSLILRTVLCMQSPQRKGESFWKRHHHDSY